MEISQLRAFVEIAKLGQLTRAADRLHLSQPALSGQLKALEESLGVSLFERSSSGMTLTSGGRSLLRAICAVCGEVFQVRPQLVSPELHEGVHAELSEEEA